MRDAYCHGNGERLSLALISWIAMTCVVPLALCKLGHAGNVVAGARSSAG